MGVDKYGDISLCISLVCLAFTDVKEQETFPFRLHRVEQPESDVFITNVRHLIEEG